MESHNPELPRSEGLCGKRIFIIDDTGLLQQGEVNAARRAGRHGKFTLAPEPKFDYNEARLFRRFSAGQGTGLGLSISHDLIVQQQRGEIKVETEEGSLRSLWRGCRKARRAEGIGHGGENFFFAALHHCMNALFHRVKFRDDNSLSAPP
ncbi:hypothetical protein HUU39_28120 [candidate division KSB1 bacterium]|nr:hypothetical protein [bacterium]NUM69088.1 hypothetical protein [candidate division KSB1 bacterium]